MGVRKFIARKLVRRWTAAVKIRQRNRAPEDRLRLVWTSLSQDTLLRWLFWRLPMTNPRENRNSFLARFCATAQTSKTLSFFMSLGNCKRRSTVRMRSCSSKPTRGTRRWVCFCPVECKNICAWEQTGRGIFPDLRLRPGSGIRLLYISLTATR